MSDAELRRHLLTAFEYSYRHDDWVTPLDELLEGISAEQALAKPPWAEKGVWEIVLHLAVWHENIVERILMGQKAHPPEGAWPPVPEAATDEEWVKSKERLGQALDSVRRMLETVPLDQISASPYGLADLLCRFTHNGYHLGQITKLREALGIA